jgi:hypothetical protein
MDGRKGSHDLVDWLRKPEACAGDTGPHPSRAISRELADISELIVSTTSGPMPSVLGVGPSPGTLAGSLVGTDIESGSTANLTDSARRLIALVGSTPWPSGIPAFIA